MTRRRQVRLGELAERTSGDVGPARALVASLVESAGSWCRRTARAGRVTQRARLRGGDVVFRTSLAGARRAGTRATAPPHAGAVARAGTARCGRSFSAGAAVCNRNGPRRGRVPGRRMDDAHALGLGRRGSQLRRGVLVVSLLAGVSPSPSSVRAAGRASTSRLPSIACSQSRASGRHLPRVRGERRPARPRHLGRSVQAGRRPARGAAMIAMTVTMVRGGALTPRVNSELRAGAGGAATFAVTSAGCPAVSGVRLGYPEGEQRLRAARREVPAFPSLRRAIFDARPQDGETAAAELKIWAHRSLTITTPRDCPSASKRMSAVRPVTSSLNFSRG
jgi:hypothetical protein